MAAVDKIIESQVYAERDLTLAVEIMRKIG